jgi:hypothetical protein
MRPSLSRQHVSRPAHGLANPANPGDPSAMQRNASQVARLTAPNDQVRNLVCLVIEKHGFKAPSFAQREALRARRKGDLERAETWTRVARSAEDALTGDLN